MNKTNKLPDITKYALFNCYRVVKEYLCDENLWEEDRYSKMYCDLFNYKICIPDDIFETIKEYIDDHLSPIIEDPYSVFDFSKMDDTSDLTEEEKRHLALEFIGSTAKIDDEFEEFAIENIKPLLMG